MKAVREPQSAVWRAPNRQNLPGAQQALPGGGRGWFHNALILHRDFQVGGWPDDCTLKRGNPEVRPCRL